MKIKSILLVPLFLSLSGVGFFNTIANSYAGPTSASSTEFEFFKGKWQCTIKKSGKTFSWLVTEGLGGSWLSGVVQLGESKVTHDYWRISNGKIERYAFTADALLVKVDSKGWQGNQLIFTGIFSKPTEETQMRQTITRVNDREFLAVWERFDGSQRWNMFSEESCSRQ